MARKILFGFGLLLVASGILWAAQGSGYFPYPASSFMLDQRPWVFRGIVTALCGAVAIAWSRRL